MALSVGKLAVFLGLDAKGFNTGLTGAVRGVRGFSASISSASNSLLNMRNMMVAAAAVGLGYYVKRSMDAIDRTAKLSESLGLSTEQMVAYQHAAELSGVEDEQLAKAFQRMEKNISDAGNGLTTSIRAFDALGLKYEELREMSPDEAMRKIGDSLQSLPNQTDRVRVALDLFGRSGLGMLNVFRDGSKSIDEASRETKKFGIAFSDIDGQAVQMANDAMTRLGQAIKGVGVQLSIQLAPFITVAADKLTDLAASGTGAGDNIVAAFNWVLRVIGKVADYFELLKSLFHAFEAAVLSGLALILTPVGLLIKGLAKIGDLLGMDTIGMVAFGDALLSFKDQAADAFNAGQKAMDNFVSGVNSKKVEQAIADMREKIGKAAEDLANLGPKQPTNIEKSISDSDEAALKLIARFQEMSDTFGMTSREAEIFKIGTANPELIAQLRGLDEHLKTMEAIKKANDDLKKQSDAMDAEAKSIIDATRTPLEKYEETITRLDELLNAGKLDWDTYGRAVRNARNELENANKVPEAGDVAAVERGTAAAFAATSTARTNQTDKSIDKNTSETAVHTRNMSAAIKSLSDYIRSNPDASVTVTF